MESYEAYVGLKVTLPATVVDDSGDSVTCDVLGVEVLTPKNKLIVVKPYGACIEAIVRRTTSNGAFCEISGGIIVNAPFTRMLLHEDNSDIANVDLTSPSIWT